MFDRRGKLSHDNSEFSYEQFTFRNDPFLAGELQERVRKTRLLIAGCGIGSTIAEAAVRVGFEHLILVDGDSVAIHNLNRQDFVAADIGQPKVNALMQRLKAINPLASIEACNTWITEENAASFVSCSDFIFDTIDFLSLEGIVALHDACHKADKPIISALAVGWGAGVVFFPEHGHCTFRELFLLPKEGSVKDFSYVKQFSFVVEKISQEFDPIVIQALQKSLATMEDGKPCPASQVSGGSFAVASLATTMLIKIMRGEKVTVAPQMVLVNLAKTCFDKGIDLSSK